MTNNDELALKLKQTAQLVHDNEHISNYGKLEAWKVRFRHTASPANILALLAERDADKNRIAELEAREETLRPVGVMSEKAFYRLERSESRFIALWPRPGIHLPRKRPDDGLIVYARTAAGIKLEVGD